MHREAGELERFDCVIANPPFSQNYTKEQHGISRAFPLGLGAYDRKKGDLMFAQHMLAACKPTGMVTTVMPHGVLFRGGAEKEIRKKFLEQDLIEAIIGLPPNLFYGAGIPACILVMRPNLTGQSPNPNKLENRRGQILFINADAEFRRLGVQPKRIHVRDLGYCWGSCGKSHVVYFNWKLLQLPPRIIDYVIAHELAHLLEPHHGPDVWRILDRSLPDWRVRAEELASKARDTYWSQSRMK